MATALDSSSAEYVTLKEMFGVLVDYLADNAPVIPQLNSHLHASDLIPKAVFNTVQHPGPRATPYDRCNDMLTLVLAKVESNPACFYSLIELLEEVELYDIVFKLEEKLQSEQKSREKDSDYKTDTTSESSTSDDDEEYMNSSSASTSDDKVSHSLPFPYVHTPPTLTYAMIDKMTEKGGSSSDKAMSTLQQSNNDTESSASALQQFSKQFSYVKGFLKKRSIKVNEGPKGRKDSFSLNKANHDDLIGNFQKGRYQFALSSLLSFTDSEYLKSVTSSKKFNKANLLHHAAYWGWIDIINKLVDDHGFDPMSTSIVGQAAVHYAVLGKKVEAFKVLVTKHCCDPIRKDLENKTPLFAATERGCFDIIKYYMTSLGYDGNTICNGKPLGIVAAEHGHLHILKYLIEECKFDVSKTCSENNTVLDVAARFGHFKIVKYLIVECKCDPKKKDWYGMKPLHHASKNGHLDIVKYLISECNCSVHEAVKGLSPLKYATENGHFELVKYFVLECDCNAETALQLARSLEILKFLSEKSDKNPDYNASLENAIKRKHTEVVEYLVARWGKDTDLSDRLFNATRYHNFQTVDFLINECHVSIDNIDSNGRTLLHYAAEGIYTMNGLLVVKCLLAAGLDPLKKDKKGKTPLAIARRSENWKVTMPYFEAFGKTKTLYPVNSYVNILIVGNSGAGKSTLSKLIEKTDAYGFLKEYRYVSPSEVEPLTAGIVPIKFDHKLLRNVVLHDFAGQSEYYLSHTAIIENILQGSAAVIIIVVDVSNSDYLIHLKQWLAVVRNETQKAKGDCQVIVVASHIDCLNSDAEKEVTIEIKKELPRNDDVIVYLDCRKLTGANLTSFLRNLQSACSYIRNNNKKSLTLYCHMMYKLLQESEKDILTLCDIAHDAATKDGECFLPTHNGKEILNILSSLHSTGLIYYLNCEDNNEEVWTHSDEYIKVSTNCRIWVIKNKQLFLQHVDGVLFSPFEESKIPSNGIITVSKLEKMFPEYDSIMLISFLESMGLCHVVSPFFLIQTNLVDKGQNIGLKDILCLFFPSSVTIERPVIPHVFVFGWCLKCTNLHNLFPQRFFNSLFLHFSMKYVAEEASRAGHSKYQCSFWKNGLKWSDRNGNTTLIELVDENQCVLVLMSCEKGAKKLNMVMLRRRLINNVLAIRRKFCPTLDTEAFVIDPDNLKYPINKPKTRVVYCVENFIKLGKHDFINPTPETPESCGKPVCDVLPDEPDYENLSIFGGDEPNDKAGAGENFHYSRTGSLIRRDKKRELSIKDLNYVIDTLRQNHFPDRLWKELGHELGLDDSTLDDINEEYGTLRERFKKCLHTWLKREDSNKQTKSWKTLVEALDKMGQKEVAKSIRSKTYRYPTSTIRRKSSCAILPHEPHNNDLSIFGEAEQCYSESRIIQSGDNKEKEFITLKHDWNKPDHHLKLELNFNIDDIDEKCRTLSKYFLEKCQHTWLIKEDTTKLWKPLDKVLDKMRHTGSATATYPTSTISHDKSSGNKQKELKFTRNKEKSVITAQPSTTGDVIGYTNTIPKPPELNTSFIEKIKGIFGDVTDLIVDINGLIHHCSQYGVTLIIPEGAVQKEQMVTVHFGTCLYSSKIKFGNYIPVTPIVWVYINQELMKPAELHLPHHVNAADSLTKSKLTLLTARDEFFNENELCFTVDNDSVLEVDFALCKTFLDHFCSTCAGIEKSSFKDIQKRCGLAVAEKQESDATLLFHYIIFPSQLACRKTIKEQYSQKDFSLEFSFKDMNFGNDGISVIFYPDNLKTLGWTRSHCGIYVDKIFEDDVDYHKVMHCQDGEVSTKNIDELKDLEKHCQYPPRFCYKFTCMDRKVAQKVTEVLVTLQGSSVNFRHNINLKQPGYDPSKEIPNLLTPEEEDDTSSQSQIYLDSILLGSLEVIPSTFEECQHHEKWFSLGYTLGLSPSELHSIESKHSTPVQYARVILLLWREKNKEASLEPLIAALEKVCLSEAATKLKHHFQVDSSPVAAKPAKRVSEEGILPTVPEVAYKVMSECTSDIKDCEIDLHVLAGKLLEKKIINERQRKAAVDEHSRRTTDQRMDQLLDIIKKSVKKEGKVFDYILEILKDEDTILANNLYDDMTNKYEQYK